MERFIIKGRLIGSAGLPEQNGLVAVEGEGITYAGPAESFHGGVHGATVIDRPGISILPGFIDCHTHLTGQASLSGAVHTARLEDLLLSANRDMGEILDAGFTSVRDMGRFGPALSDAVAGGISRGPRILPSGRILSVTAGHGDEGPAYTKEECNRRSLLSVLVDGVDECLAAAREQFRQGARFIKVMATGGVSSATDGLEDVQFSPEELGAIVAEARRHGTYVAAHCSGTAGTLQALEAGVTSIEHGIMLDERCVELMAAGDCTLVTTLAVSFGIPKMQGLPAHMYEKGKQCAIHHRRSIEMARKAGIRIALGTDFSGSKNTPYRETGREFAAMVEAGLTPQEAIEAGTKHAAHLLGMSDRLGTLEAGKLADLVIVDGNPLEEISLLADADRIKLVMQGGRVCKDRLHATL